MRLTVKILLPVVIGVGIGLGFHLSMKLGLPQSSSNFLNMVNGKKYNAQLFAIDWVLILSCWSLLFFSKILSKKLILLFSLSGFNKSSEKKIGMEQKQILSFETKTISTLTEQERLYFEKQVLLKSGLVYKNKEQYLNSLDSIIENSIQIENRTKHLNKEPMLKFDSESKIELESNSETKNSNITQFEKLEVTKQESDSWITLDLGELADWEERGLQNLNSLDRSSEDLLAEQEVFIYGAERIPNFDNKIENMPEDQSYQSDESRSSMNSYKGRMKVIYRKK